MRSEDEVTQASRSARELRNLDDVVARVLERNGPVRLTGLRGAARAVAAAHLVRAHGERPVLVLVPNAKAADGFLDDLRATLGDPPENGRVRVFPHHDTHPYERFSPQPFLVAQRMDALYRWLASAEPAAAVAYAVYLPGFDGRDRVVVEPVPTLPPAAPGR